MSLLPGVMGYPVLYEVNTRCWLSELSDKAGRHLTLAEVPDSEFEFWQQCGFTHLWLMGVWTLGAVGRAWSQRFYRRREQEFGCSDIVGSPYAICGYTVSPRLGGDAALAAFRQKLNERGIKLLLDFIPNHTAIDHPWVKEHPEFYVTSADAHDAAVKPRNATRWFAYGSSGHDAPWIDTLQLDYRNPDLRRAMITQLVHVAERCDGVRCDMAMLVLNEIFASTWKAWSGHRQLRSDNEREFWSEAIEAARSGRSTKTPAAKAPREFLFLAEAYWNTEAKLQELGFDYTYDKLLYDKLLARNAAATTSYLHSLSPEFIAHSAHFIENHDERRAASILSPKEHAAAALLIAALPGMRFFHEGQFEGRQVHANVHFARRGEEAANEWLSKFYRTLMRAVRESALRDGEAKLLRASTAWEDNTSYKHFALLQWQSAPGPFYLVVVNLSGYQSQCYAPLQVGGLASSRWKLNDLLGDEEHVRDGEVLADRGLFLDVAPHAAQLFQFTPTN